MAAAAVLPGANGGVPAARLRRAELADARALAELYCAGEGDMLAWLRTGGVLLVENGARQPLAAVRWQPHRTGWQVEPIRSLPAEQGQEYGRWLMTKLEALAIRGNVARLDVTLDDPELTPYYERLGYRASTTEASNSSDDSTHDSTYSSTHDSTRESSANSSGASTGTARLSKRVGGVWQRQEAAS